MPCLGGSGAHPDCSVLLPEIFASTEFPCSPDLVSHDLISYSALHTSLGQADKLCISAVAIPSLPAHPSASAREQQMMCHQRATSAPPHRARAQLGDADIPSGIPGTTSGQIRVIKGAPSRRGKDPGLQHKPKLKKGAGRELSLGLNRVWPGAQVGLLRDINPCSQAGRH